MNKSNVQPLPILAAVAALLCLGAPAARAQTLAPGKPDPVPVKQTESGYSPTAYANVYRLVKNRYVALNDDYAPLRSFDSTKPSSKGATVDELIRASAKTVNEKATSLIIIQRTAQLSSVEAQALAYPLPLVAPGNYGYVLNAYVQKVVDKDTVILSDLQLINETELQSAKDDASTRSYMKVKSSDGKRTQTGTDETEKPDKRVVETAFEQRTKLVELQHSTPFRSLVRLHGYNTESAVEKARWPGPSKSGVKPAPDADPAGPTNSVLHIAIVGVGYDDSGNKKTSSANASGKSTKSSGKRVFEAVPVELFARGITEEQFKDLLDKRGMTAQQVTEIGIKEVRSNPAEAAQNVVDAIEKLKADAEK